MWQIIEKPKAYYTFDFDIGTEDVKVAKMMENYTVILVSNWDLTLFQILSDLFPEYVFFFSI